VFSNGHSYRVNWPQSGHLSRSRLLFEIHGFDIVI